MGAQICISIYANGKDITACPSTAGFTKGLSGSETDSDDDPCLFMVTVAAAYSLSVDVPLGAWVMIQNVWAGKLPLTSLFSFSG